MRRLGERWGRGVAVRTEEKRVDGISHFCLHVTTEQNNEIEWS